MRSSAFWSAMIMLLLAGCQDRASTAQDSIRIANRYLEGMNIDAKSREVKTIDMGDRWRLSYDYREGGTGGPIIVVVNKRSGKVVHSESEQ